MNRKKIIWGSVLCMIACISWGAMFPVADRAFAFIHPFYFSVIRYGIVSILLAAALWRKEGRKAFRLEGRGKALLFYGTMAFTVYNLFVFLGQQMMGDAGTVAASIMESLMPMITVVIVWITTRSMPAVWTLTSIVMALVGAFLVITRGDIAFFASISQNLIPLALLCAGAVGWVLYSIGGTHFKHWSALRYSTLTCLLGTAVSGLFTGIGSIVGLIPVPSMESILAVKSEMSFMILFPGLIALIGWNAGIKMISAVNGILFINLVPITTFIIMALQGYHISPVELLGTALIVAALLQNSLYQRKALNRPFANPTLKSVKPAKHKFESRHV